MEGGSQLPMVADARGVGVLERPTLAIFESKIRRQIQAQQHASSFKTFMKIIFCMMKKKHQGLNTLFALIPVENPF